MLDNNNNNNNNNNIFIKCLLDEIRSNVDQIFCIIKKHFNFNKLKINK